MIKIISVNDSIVQIPGKYRLGLCCESKELLLYDDVNNEVICFSIPPGTAEADIELLPEDSCIYGDIVLRKKTDSGSRTFRLKTNTSRLRPGDNEKDLIVCATPYREILRVSPYCIIDTKGNFSENVTLRIHSVNTNDTLLTLTADKAWLNAPERAFPVHIKFLVLCCNKAPVETYQYRKGLLLWSPASCTVGVSGKEKSCFACDRIHRMYMGVILPRSVNNIKKAELCIRQRACGINAAKGPLLALYYIHEDITTNSCACYPEDCTCLLETVKVKKGTQDYRFDISSLIDGRHRSGGCVNLMLKLYDENTSEDEKVLLAGGSCPGEVRIKFS